MLTQTVSVSYKSLRALEAGHKWVLMESGWAATAAAWSPSVPVGLRCAVGQY